MMQEKNVLSQRFSVYSFALATGYASPGSSTLDRLREAIERLSAVTVLIAKPGFRGSCRILSRYAEDTETGEVVVGLNPQLTAAVLAQNEYLRLDFEGVRKLKGDPTRLIHSHLHWINQRARRVLLLSTLCEYVYGDNSVSPSGEANRKAAVREGLAELKGLGWSIRKTGTEHYEIARPAQPPSAYAQRRRESTGRTVTG